ncbi:hypothetical protein SDC9_212056 [bioreactor metagenome]|uniref:Uncharacterized protein n=1 Tax=bioreactor metagenome TaxID=1076179 RepID=A0A645JKU0_9ZZZZ
MGKCCSEGDPLDFHTNTEHKKDTQENIEKIIQDSDHHRDPRVLHTDKPTIEGIQPQHRRSSKYDDMKIGHHMLGRFRTRLYQTGNQHPDRVLQEYDKQSYSQANYQ